MVLLESDSGIFPNIFLVSFILYMEVTQTKSTSSFLIFLIKRFILFLFQWFWFVSLWACDTCVSVCSEVRRGYWILGSRSYRRLWAAKIHFSGKEASALNWWAIFPFQSYDLLGYENYLHVNMQSSFTVSFHWVLMLPQLSCVYTSMRYQAKCACIKLENVS